MTEIIDALQEAIADDQFSIVETLDGVVTVTDEHGCRFAVGYDGPDDNDTDWWTGTRYSSEGTEAGTDSWTSLEGLVGAVVEWTRPMASDSSWAPPDD